MPVAHPDSALYRLQILNDTSLQKVKRNQSCLEPCLRQLVSCLESFVVGSLPQLQPREGEGAFTSSSSQAWGALIP